MAIKADWDLTSLTATWHFFALTVCLFLRRTCVYIYKHIPTYIYIYICTYTYICISLHIHTYVIGCMCMQGIVCLYICVFMQQDAIFLPAHFYFLLLFFLQFQVTLRYFFAPIQFQQPKINSVYVFTRTFFSSLTLQRVFRLIFVVVVVCGRIHFALSVQARSWK